MPELPEVETTKNIITPAILNQKIKSITIYNPKLRWNIPRHLPQTLKDEKIIDVNRRAKYLLITTTNGTLIIHLGMTGCLKILAKNTPLIKHDHFEIELKQKFVVRYNDPRKFGFILWTKDSPYEHKLLARLGPEPLDRKFNANYLFNTTSTKPIKNLLMDNYFVTGVGNIYATEALYSAKILPTRPAREVTLDEARLLVKEIKKILKKSIKAGGTTLKDFYSPDGKPGYFKQQLLVYGRKGENCLHCNDVLQAIVLGQRTTTFCRTCQT